MVDVVCPREIPLTEATVINIQTRDLAEKIMREVERIRNLAGNQGG
jgi:hypothetical protein